MGDFSGPRVEGSRIVDLLGVQIWPLPDSRRVTLAALVGFGPVAGRIEQVESARRSLVTTYRR